MSSHRDFTVASASQLRGSLPAAASLQLRDECVQLMDQMKKTGGSLKRSSALRRNPRTSPPLTQNVSGELPDTQSRNAQLFSESPPTSTARPALVHEPSLELLQPVSYSKPTKPAGSSPRSLPDEGSQASAKAGPHESPSSKGDQFQISDDVSARRHMSNLSTSSTSSSIGGQRSLENGDKVYFTPTVLRKSQLFEIPSPPLENPVLPPALGDECPTPRVSSNMTRPPSEIFVGTTESPEHVRGGPKRNQASIGISPAQADQLVTALAKSRLVQKHVRQDWLDIEELPDDDGSIFSFGDVSLPTLTSASTLYSRQNENFVRDDATSTSSPPREHATGPLGGVALCDPKWHGTPVRYVSPTYNLGHGALDIGAYSFLETPDDAGVHCSLRIEPPSASHPNVRILLHCVNQVVTRESGKPAFLLTSDEDVTLAFTHAALAETAAGAAAHDIHVRSPPTTTTTTTTSTHASSTIDWVALADDLQADADAADAVDAGLAALAALHVAEPATAPTRTLLRLLSRIANQHRDLLVLRPTAFFPDGRPARMGVPWVSRALYADWYRRGGGGGGDAAGWSATARTFQQRVLEEVGTRYCARETFYSVVYWEHQALGIRCVPLRDGKVGGEAAVWVCFIQGDPEVSPLD